jgi:hypothetical protein
MKKGVQQKAADDRACDANDDVGDAAKPTAGHHTSRDRARDQPDDDPGNP